MEKIKTIFNVANATEDTPARMDLYGFVGANNYWDDSAQAVTTKGVNDALAEIEGNSVDVHINSYGGDAFEGIGIYNALKQSDKTINIYIDAIAASAASVIAMAGDTIFIPSNAQLMVHHALTFEYGNAQDFAKAIDMLNKMDNSLIATYKTRFAGTDQELNDLLDAETWLNADEAVAFGFADKIIDYSEDDDQEDKSENVKNSLFDKYSKNHVAANAIHEPEPVPEPVEPEEPEHKTSMAEKLANLI